MEKNFITCNEAIRNGNEKVISAMRNFVAKSSRGKRRERLLNSRYIPREFGILGRLWYYPETEKVYYCAGQDYTTEMGILRDIFDGNIK